MRFTDFGFIWQSSHGRYEQRKGMALAKGVADYFQLSKDLFVRFFLSKYADHCSILMEEEKYQP